MRETGESCWFGSQVALGTAPSSPSEGRSRLSTTPLIPRLLHGCRRVSRRKTRRNWSARAGIPREEPRHSDTGGRGLIRRSPTTRSRPGSPRPAEKSGRNELRNRPAEMIASEGGHTRLSRMQLAPAFFSGSSQARYIPLENIFKDPAPRSLPFHGFFSADWAHVSLDHAWISIDRQSGDTLTPDTSDSVRLGFSSPLDPREVCRALNVV